MSKLNVRRVLLTQLQKEWNPSVPVNFSVNKMGVRFVYVKSNAKGEIKWDTTLLYSMEELIEKNDVVVLLKEVVPVKATSTSKEEIAPEEVEDAPEEEVATPKAKAKKSKTVDKVLDAS